MNKCFQTHLNEFQFNVYNQKPSVDLIQVNQQHTSCIIEFIGQATASLIADGIIAHKSQLKDLALAIKTADCLPIAFYGQEYVALVHAGWRGLADGILTQKSLQAIAWQEIVIGPSICTYEVQPEFQQYFPDSPHFEQRADRLYFNLQQEALSQLQYFSARMRFVDVCTLKNTDYNSYRRDQTPQRNWNILMRSV